MTPLAIPDALLARIYAHARAAFPDECCGYLVGADVLVDVVACENTAETDRGREFQIGGRELLAFARSFDGASPARIVYHSHPNGRAYFSATDRAMATTAAYPVQHLVVGVTAEAVTEAALFAQVDDDIIEVARWTP